MKLAIIGSGKIVHEAVPALRENPAIEITALCVRPQSAEKGSELAAQFGVPRVFTDYDALLASDAADTVYIAVINPLHYSYALRAIQARKHVILEKPLCVTAEEARGLEQAVASAGDVYLYEAVTCRHTPVFHQLRDKLPQIGRIWLVQANYSQYSSRYDDYLRGIVRPAFDPAAFGGALYDLNVYNIQLVAALFGAPPERPDAVTYTANRGFNGVDTSGCLVLGYDGFTAVLTAAKDCDGPCATVLQGEKGWIRIPGKINELASLELCTGSSLKFRTDASDTAAVGSAIGGTSESWRRMVPEFQEFERNIREGRYDEMRADLAVSVSVVGVIERALQHS